MPVDEPIQYSARLGHITSQQFQAALERFDLGTFIAAEPILAGLFGQNVFVTSTVGEFVLRGDPHYPWQFPKERLVAQLLHEQTKAPVPWPYLLDNTTDIFGWEYILMPRLSGLQITDAEVCDSFSPMDRLAIAEAMSEMLVTLHTLTWPHPAEYSLNTDSFVPIEDAYADWVAADVRYMRAMARRHSDWTTPADAGWVEDVLASGHAALAEPFTPSIVHHDFKHGNTVAQHTGTRWRITGVFDLMETYMGDGETDLARLTGTYIDLDRDPTMARAFVQSYLQRCPPRSGFAERFAVYLLADRLLMWEYGQRHPELEWWDRQLSLREWAEPYILAIPSLL